MFQYYIYKKRIAENIDRLNLGKGREGLKIPKKTTKENDDFFLRISLYFRNEESAKTPCFIDLVMSSNG